MDTKSRMTEGGRSKRFSLPAFYFFSIGHSDFAPSAFLFFQVLFIDGIQESR
jgi:hypothetical protein